MFEVMAAVAFSWFVWSIVRQPLERWFARAGQRKARQILDDAGLPYDLWCDACNLPVPTESTPNPVEPIRPGVSTECLLDHPEHHRIVYRSRS